MQNYRLSFVAIPGVPQGCIMSAQTERLIYKILKSSKSLASGGRSTQDFEFAQDKALPSHTQVQIQRKSSK